MDRRKMIKLSEKNKTRKSHIQRVWLRQGEILQLLIILRI